MPRASFAANDHVFMWPARFFGAMKPVLVRLFGEWHYGRWLRMLHFRRVVKRLPLDLSTAEILDVGCGKGNNALWLAARHPGCYVLGVDIDAAEIDDCRRQAQQLGLDNVRFETTSLEDLDADCRFDFVYSIAVLELVPDDAAAVARLAPLLRPGGVLLIDVPELNLGADSRFGLRRFMRPTNAAEAMGYVRQGYTLSHLYDLLDQVGLRVRGARYTMAPPALFAHTVFEALRARHLRWYFILLPFLRVVGYADLLLRWNRGSSLMMWAQQTSALSLARPDERR